MPLIPKRFIFQTGGGRKLRENRITEVELEGGVKTGGVCVGGVVNNDARELGL